MAEQTKLELVKREAVGSNAVRGLRKTGKVPVVLYGHGEASVPLIAKRRDLNAVLAHKAQFLEVSIDGKPETALIREVQYDTYGQDVLHVDLVRVSMDESVVVSVPIDYRGMPAGLSEGGMLQKLMTDVEIRVSPRHMPESIILNVADLHLGDTVEVKDLILPESAEIVGDLENLVCSVMEQRGRVDEVEEAAEGEGEGADSQPEVIGHKKDDDESSD